MIETDTTELVGAHPTLLAALQRADLAARCTSPVLIVGETGTGVSGLAARIHASSPRAARPFVRVACGTARFIRGLADARGGTLFLDDVAALGKREQLELAALLRGRTDRMWSGPRAIGGDIRVIAGCAGDLRGMVASGHLREDLRYLLDVVRIVVPPLRLRRSDIPDLVASALRRLDDAGGRAHVPFTESALAALRLYAWPGNMAEVEDVVRHASARAVDRAPDVSDLPARVTANVVRGAPSIPGSTIAEIQRYVIEHTLAACGGSTARAATTLGISLRTLQHRMRGWQ